MNYTVVQELINTSDNIYRVSYSYSLKRSVSTTLHSSEPCYSSWGLGHVSPAFPPSISAAPPRININVGGPPCPIVVAANTTEFFETVETSDCAESALERNATYAVKPQQEKHSVRIASTEISSPECVVASASHGCFPKTVTSIFGSEKSYPGRPNATCMKPSRKSCVALFWSSTRSGDSSQSKTGRISPPTKPHDDRAVTLQRRGAFLRGNALRRPFLDPIKRLASAEKVGAGRSLFSRSPIGADKVNLMGVLLARSATFLCGGTTGAIHSVALNKNRRGTTGALEGWRRGTTGAKWGYNWRGIGVQLAHPYNHIQCLSVFSVN